MVPVNKFNSASVPSDVVTMALFDSGNWNPLGVPVVNSSSNGTDAETENDPAILYERANRVITVTAQADQTDSGNEALTVNITASETAKTGILGYQFELLYDQNVIAPEALPCDVSGTLSETQTAVCAGEPGVLKVFVYGTTPLIGVGNLLKLNFKRVGTKDGQSPLMIKNFMFNEGLPRATTIDGQVSIAVLTSRKVTSDWNGGNERTNKRTNKRGDF